MDTVLYTEGHGPGLGDGPGLAYRGPRTWSCIHLVMDPIFYIEGLEPGLVCKWSWTLPLWTPSCMHRVMDPVLYKWVFTRSFMQLVIILVLYTDGHRAGIVNLAHGLCLVYVGHGPGLVYNGHRCGLIY